MGIHITLIQPVSNPYKFKFKRSPSAAFFVTDSFRQIERLFLSFKINANDDLMLAAA